MSCDDIESENSLTTLAGTSPNSVPRNNWVGEICAEKVKFNTMSTSDQLLFHSKISLARIRGNKAVPLSFDKSHHSPVQVVIEVNLMIHWIQAIWAMIHWIQTIWTSLKKMQSYENESLTSTSPNSVPRNSWVSEICIERLLMHGCAQVSTSTLK